MSVTWYKTTKLHGSIEAVEIEKENHCSVVVKHTALFSGKPYTRRMMKTTEYDCYYPFFDEAKNALIKQFQDEITRLQEKLDFYRKTLVTVHTLVEKDARTEVVEKSLRS